MAILTPQELQDSGIQQELNRLFLHPMGCHLRLTSGGSMVVDDFRAYNEGYVFLNHDPVLMAARESERTIRVFEKALYRQGAYGWIVQPTDAVLSNFQTAPPRP